MTHRQLARFACRLLALYLVSHALPSTTYITLLFLQGNLSQALQTGGSITMVSLWAFIGALWMLADPIANRMIPIDQHHNQPNHTSPESIAVIAIAILGLYLACTGFVSLSSKAQVFLFPFAIRSTKPGGMETVVIFMNLIPPILQLALGYILTFHATPLYNFIQKHQSDHPHTTINPTQD